MVLVGHYPLDEDSGSTANDRSGNGNDGTVSGATPGATGVLGTTCYSFDATDDYVTTGITTLPSNHTFAAWVNLASVESGGNTSDGQFIVRSEGTDTATLRNSSTGEWEFAVFDGSASTTQISITGSTPTAGTWYHVVGVYDEDAGEGTLYVDGEVDGSDTSSFTLDTSATDISFGGRNDGTRPLNGDLDDVRIYNRALTATEISYLYEATTRPCLVTATKTHSSSVQPDLGNLNYSLNGEGATIYVIGSPGTASEEVQSAVLDGSTSFTLSWSSGHTDFRIDVRGDPLSNPENRVEFQKIALTA